MTPEELKKKILDSQIWRSMFRGGAWKDTPRDRAQHILGNVWLHLHPSRVRKNSLKWNYTFGLGGLSFLLFLILTVTGVLLMFYYRPSVDLAYRDMKDLEYAVSVGAFLRAMHRWSAHAMVLIVILHMVRVFLTGSYKTPREFNWVGGVISHARGRRSVFDCEPFQRCAFRFARRNDRRRQYADPLLRAALRAGAG